MASGKRKRPAARKKRQKRSRATLGKISFTAEREAALLILHKIVKKYGPFRYTGIHSERGRCACGGLAVTRLVFVGKRRKRLLLHTSCARHLGMAIPTE